jgi:hypothetical protein
MSRLQAMPLARGIARGKTPTIAERNGLAPNDLTVRSISSSPIHLVRARIPVFNIPFTILDPHRKDIPMEVGV